MKLRSFLFPEKPAKPKKERKPREKKPPGEKKEKASGGSAKNGTGSPKKGKKKNPWSDSEDDKSMGSDVSDVELETSFSNDLIEREKGPRRAAGTSHETFVFVPSSGGRYES